MDHFYTLYPEQLCEDRHDVSCEQRIYSLNFCKEYLGKFSDTGDEITGQILDGVQ